MALGLPHWCSIARQESDCTLPLRAWKAGKLRFYSVLMKPNIAEYDLILYNMQLATFAFFECLVLVNLGLHWPA